MKTLRYGMGWQRDLPDFRDYGLESDETVEALPSQTRALKPSKTLAPDCDLSDYCSPVEDQGPLGSCTANAGVGLLEYYENRAYGRFIDASRLFLRIGSKLSTHCWGIAPDLNAMGTPGDS